MLFIGCSLAYGQKEAASQEAMSGLSVALEEDLEELEGASITEMGDLVTMKGDTLIYNATSFHTTSDASLGIIRFPQWQLQPQENRK